MEIKLTESNIRAGEERAFRLFERAVAGGASGFVQRDGVRRFRGVGREMVRKIYAVARHVEGARLGEAFAERGVDTVSLSAVRTALRRIGDGLVTLAKTRAPEGEEPDGILGGTRAELGQASSTGGSFARYVHRSR